MSQHLDDDLDNEGGAFGVSEDVDWESTGFAAEDLSGRPVQPKKQAAPRPAPSAPAQPSSSKPAATPAQAQPAQQSPTQAPTPAQAPAPLPSRQPVTPSAPAGQTTPSLPQQPARPTYQAPAPAPAPAPATAPAPAQPAVQAQVPTAPQPAYQQPSEPLPVQAVAAPNGNAYSQAPAGGYTPATTARLEDLNEPEWARIVPTVEDDTADDEPAFSGAPFEDSLYPTQPGPDDTPRRGSRSKDRRAPAQRPAKAPRTKKQPTAREGKTSQYAGGRWKVKALRFMVYTVLGVLMLGGAKNVVTSEEPPTTAALAAEVKAELGYTGFPTEQAEGFALRFAREYLTYGRNGADAREQRLMLYSPAAASGDYGWDGNGNQSVTAGPYVAAPSKVEDEHFATITVSAELSSGKWVALAVPVYADDNGSLVVSGPPAFVALPAAAENPGKDRTFEEDDALQDELTPQMAGFFEQWGASDQQELSLYLSPDASIAAQTGLGGAVTFDTAKGSSVDVVMPLGDSTRTGTVTVTWSVEQGGLLSQSYTVTVTEGDGGRWYVQDIGGGVVADSTDAATSTTDAIGDETGTDTGSGLVQLNDGTENE